MPYMYAIVRYLRDQFSPRVDLCLLKVGRKLCLSRERRFYVQSAQLWEWPRPKGHTEVLGSKHPGL